MKRNARTHAMRALRCAFVVGRTQTQNPHEVVVVVVVADVLSR